MCVCVGGRGRAGSDGRLLVAAHLGVGVDVPLVVVVLADVHAQVAALLGAVGAVGALVRGRLAAALHVLVAPQRGLPAVALAAVLALEVARRVLARLALGRPALLSPLPPVAPVPRLVRERARVGREAAVRVVERVGVLGQHDVVRVVVLRVRVPLGVLLGGQFQI